MKYTELVQTRLTDEQSATLEKLADAEGLTVASYVRRIILKEINFAETGIDGWPVKESQEGEE
jgi:predicted DNA-binding protein